MIVPSSTPRQPFKPTAAEDQPIDVARATQIIKGTKQKQKQIAAAIAAVAAAQELHMLKAAVGAAGIPTAAAQLTPTTVQPVQLFQPIAAERQLSTTI